MEYSNARAHRHLILHLPKRLNINNLEKFLNCLFTATVLLQETGRMKTYQSVKNDAFERVSQMYLGITAIFPYSQGTRSVSGRYFDTSAPQLRGGLTMKAGICDIGAVQGRKFRIKNGAEMKAKKLFSSRKRSMDAWQPYTQEFGVLSLKKSWVCLFRVIHDGQRYRCEYLGASDCLEHIRTGWIMKLQWCGGSDS